MTESKQGTGPTINPAPGTDHARLVRIEEALEEIKEAILGTMDGKTLGMGQRLKALEDAYAVALARIKTLEDLHDKARNELLKQIWFFLALPLGALIYSAFQHYTIASGTPGK